MTQIYFQRAGAELELSGWCVAIIHSAPLSGNSPTHLSATKTKLQDRAGTQRILPRSREGERLLRCKTRIASGQWKVVCSVGRVPNRIMLSAPFPTAHSLLSTMAWPGKHHVHLLSDKTRARTKGRQGSKRPGAPSLLPWETAAFLESPLPLLVTQGSYKE